MTPWICRSCRLVVEGSEILRIRSLGCHRNLYGAAEENDGVAYCPYCADEILCLIPSIRDVLKLRALCGAVYQMAGVAGAPVRFLDALSAAANGDPFDTEHLLPVTEDEFEDQP